ncbi:TetR/AcrR family transcriptional regulator [Variovorax sp. 770b2]|uniref:TetR/AcrR family transcriptional regulator n=1 Tax=Variovorax sp. 770b2 TaxID=1566271 RepID=UPI0008EEBF36|nr:TetR/AcrR family transcriptional regulator [Variovorax sp. 770b2]SFP48348.1 transcriptional regulator, TetR family [Variovorax sp. 770b2]
MKELPPEDDTGPRTAGGRRKRAGDKEIAVAAKPLRQRLSTENRERQILDGAIAFFSERGLDGQTRELAQQIGITHPLLYHYFPNKRALIERVYEEVYLGRWRSEWEEWIEDRSQPLEDRLVRFYIDYAHAILTKEWVRILVFSGLSDGYVPDQYMELLKERLFPHIWREVRHELGISNRDKPTERELELMWGMHGGIFYIGLRRWIYGQPMPADLDAVLADRVRAFLLAAPSVFERAGAKKRSSKAAKPG